MAFCTNRVDDKVCCVLYPSDVSAILVRLHVEGADDLYGPRKHGLKLMKVMRGEPG
jgi:hypothetical protein